MAKDKPVKPPVDKPEESDEPVTGAAKAGKPLTATLLATLLPALIGLLGGGVGGIAALSRLSKSGEYVAKSGTTDFQTDTPWNPDNEIEGWWSAQLPVHFEPEAPCKTPHVRTAISSFDVTSDAGPITRVDVAVNKEAPTERGFTLKARTWGGAKKVPWIKVEWIALCPIKD